MIVLVVPLVIAALAVVTGISVVRATNEAQSSAYQNTSSVASGDAAKFDQQQSRYETMVTSLSSVLSGYHGQDRAGLNEMLHQVALDNHDLLGVYWQSEPNMGPGPDSKFRGNKHEASGVHGRFVPYWERLKGTLQSDITEPTTDGGWYTLPKRTRRFEVIEPYRYAGVLMSSYVAPVMRNGKFIGATGMDSSLVSLNQRTQQIHVLKTGYAFLVSNKGVFISAPDKKLIGKRTISWLAKEKHNPALEQIQAAVTAGRSATISTTDPFTSKSVAMFVSPIKVGNWGLVVVAPKSEMLAGANSLRTELIVIAVIALLIVSAAIALVATRLTRPLDEVRAAAERIAEGDLDVEISSHGEDEVGRTSAAFKGMVEYLRGVSGVAQKVAAGDLTVEIEPKSERDELSRSFGTMVHSLRGIVHRVSGASDELLQSSREVSGTSEEAGRAVAEIAQAVQDVAIGGERQAKIAGEARSMTVERVWPPSAPASSRRQASRPQSRPTPRWPSWARRPAT
jgi:methyl-accepting chemotaxis protein